MYRLRMKLNNQRPNRLKLARLQRSMERAAPEEVLEALCAVAVGRLRELTPRGRTGKMRAGWTQTIQRRGRRFEGTVYNVAEKDARGKIILAVLEKGSRPKTDKIYPKRASVLRFFWDRYDKMIYARYVTQVPHKAFHMLQQTRRFMRTVYKDIAAVILGRRIREAIR